MAVLGQVPLGILFFAPSPASFYCCPSPWKKNGHKQRQSSNCAAHKRQHINRILTDHLLRRKRNMTWRSVTTVMCSMWLDFGHYRKLVFVPKRSCKEHVGLWTTRLSMHVSVWVYLRLVTDGCLVCALGGSAFKLVSLVQQANGAHHTQVNPHL